MDRMGLFVIKKSDQNQYWVRSGEHGCGWNPHFPKQAFSKSELAKEILFLLSSGIGAQRIEIIELHG
jgi:hypothetical protein